MGIDDHEVKKIKANLYKIREISLGRRSLIIKKQK